MEPPIAITHEHIGNATHPPCRSCSPSTGTGCSRTDGGVAFFMEKACWLLKDAGLLQSSGFFWNKLKAGLHFCLLCMKENMFITLQH